MIDGHTKVLGVMGCPVEHTKSPAIQNYLAEKTGIHTVYVPFHVEEQDLEAAVKGAFGLGILGLNVTIPHKGEVMKSLVEIDSLAQKIGAVNTLVRISNGYKGYNTDMPGLLRAMQDDDIFLEGTRVVILGAGGVARAVALMLAENKVESIYIFNRTKEKADKIRDEIRAFHQELAVESYPLEQLDQLTGEHKYLVIQTTNVGMFPEVDNAVVTDSAFYKKVSVGYDLVYNPQETVFMKKVREAGGRAYNGLRMLVYQGIIAYELWNDIKITKELATETFDYVREHFSEL